MRFLIDGYNLMHALGLARPRGPKQLAYSRADLLAWLHRIHDPRPELVTVVFDGRQGNRPNDAIHTDQGIHVVYSVGRLADDVIEELIRRETSPRDLTVVSSDRRLEDAAGRKGCVAWACPAYIDWAIDHGSDPPRPVRAPAKPDPPTAEEVEHWRQEFADVEHDPELRRFNKMFEDFEKLD